MKGVEDPKLKLEFDQGEIELISAFVDVLLYRGYPTVVQGHLFWNGMVIKGTWQVNHQVLEFYCPQCFTECFVYSILLLLVTGEI